MAQKRTRAEEDGTFDKFKVKRTDDDLYTITRDFVHCFMAQHVFVPIFERLGYACCCQDPSNETELLNMIYSSWNGTFAELFMEPVMVLSIPMTLFGPSLRPPMYIEDGLTEANFTSKEVEYRVKFHIEKIRTIQ